MNRNRAAQEIKLVILGTSKYMDNFLDYWNVSSNISWMTMTIKCWYLKFLLCNLLIKVMCTKLFHVYYFEFNCKWLKCMEWRRVLFIWSEFIWNAICSWQSQCAFNNTVNHQPRKIGNLKIHVLQFTIAQDCRSICCPSIIIAEVNLYNPKHSPGESNSEHIKCQGGFNWSLTSYPIIYFIVLLMSSVELCSYYKLIILHY